MLSVMRRAGLTLPSVFALAALIILVALGNWQWRRMHWKEALIGRLQDAARTEPVDLTTTDPAAAAAGRRYTTAKVTGRFRHDQEAYVFWTRGSTPGFLVLTPLKPKGRRAILVNRGFVPERLKSPQTRSRGLVEGDVTVRGLLIRRTASTGIFTPPPDKAGRVWYAITPSGIASVLGLDIVGNYSLDADDAPNPGAWPQGLSTAARIARIPNRHFEYALTWWGLALTLVGVFAAFSLSRWRSVAHQAK